MQRSHRSNAGQRAGVSASALEALKAARSSTSSSRVSQLRLRDEGLVYSELSEAEYAALVQERRQAGDFVEDDGGDNGYQDDGEENWAEYTGDDERAPDDAARAQRNSQTTAHTGSRRLHCAC
jgi:hypothetical protein